LADIIILEISVRRLYEGQAEFAEIVAELNELGLFYIGNLDQQHDAFGQPIYLDAVFARQFPFSEHFSIYRDRSCLDIWYGVFQACLQIFTAVFFDFYFLTLYMLSLNRLSVLIAYFVGISVGWLMKTALFPDELILARSLEIRILGGSFAVGGCCCECAGR
jgi:hypothetical protein